MATIKAEYDRLFELELAEKLQLVEDLWDSIDPESLPVMNWHKKELAKRDANFRNNPKSAIPWEEVKKRIRKKNGRS
jgi:putative addiction module component (TIGR02574 family)